jgi:flavin-dependent dehydrogenase
MIKVAIMGAGLSGLACAITLEKNGIKPKIFEKRRQVGDRFVNCEILLSVLTKPIDDSIAYFSENHGINLKPAGNIRQLIIHSEHRQAYIRGHLGFTNTRGRHPNSFERQLEKQVKSKIIFNSKHSYEELLQDFTHVVMATGDASYAARVQDFREDLTVTLRGAIVSGDFDRYTVRAWLNNKLAPKGYGYLIPISENEANIVIGYPDYAENQQLDTHALWERFYQNVCSIYGQDLRITDNFEINKYIIGICKYPRIGNTFFTGNNFGSIMPFLGFGQFASLYSGVQAAKDICGMGNYEESIKPLRNSYQHSIVFRRAMEKLNNSKFDFMVEGLNGPLGNRVFNSNKNILKIASYLLKPLTYRDQKTE